MIPMSTKEYVKYRETTQGCLNVMHIYYKIGYNGTIKTGVVDVTDEMRNLVPTYYGSVVYAAIESVNWYDILGIENPQSTTQLDKEGVGFVAAKTPLIMWTPIGYSENPDTIYVEGVLSSNASTY